jgi:predicted metal-dependent enzyme (double-stranded beta helix superfamily)
MQTPSSLQTPRPSLDAVRGLVEVSHSLADAFFSATHRALQALLKDPSLLDGLPPADDGAFSRRLLCTDPVNRFGIWALTWPPGCRTPIHNHHCACAFGVYRGAIEETFYATRSDGEAVVESARFVRARGFIGGAPLESGMIHEMSNRDSETAVSIHVYAYRPDLHEDSIDRCFVPLRLTEEQ